MKPPPSNQSPANAQLVTGSSSTHSTSASGRDIELWPLPSRCSRPETSSSASGSSSHPSR